MAYMSRVRAQRSPAWRRVRLAARARYARMKSMPARRRFTAGRYRRRRVY